MRKRTLRSLTITLLCAAAWLALAGMSHAQWVKGRSPSRDWITDMAVSGDYLYICTRKGGIFRTADDGQTWSG